MTWPGRICDPAASHIRVASSHNVYVAVDVVDAIAVVSLATGAIAKLQARVFRVGFPANGALVAKWTVLITALGLLCRPPELNDLRRSARLIRPQIVDHVAPAYYYEIEYRDDREQGHCVLGIDHSFYDIVYEETGVDEREPLYFNRDDEEEHDAVVGEERGEGEEHRQVQEARRQEDETVPHIIQNRRIHS